MAQSGHCECHEIGGLYARRFAYPPFLWFETAYYDDLIARGSPAPNGVGSSKGKPVATSLYDLSVPTFLQTVSAVGGFLDRAASHCAEGGANPNDFVHARLFDDMAPFHFQIEAACHHSVWGVEALKTGAFTPPALVGPVPFPDLQAMIVKAETALEAFIPEEVNRCAGKHLNLNIGPRRLAFTSENFILSFSLPNFHFHAVTAYDILRSRGVPLGKRDYEGRLRTRP
jgi:hypothetical protein